MTAAENLHTVITNKIMTINALSRDVSAMFGGVLGSDTKHTNFYADYGYPTSLDFYNYFNMYERNGIAAAGIDKPIEKCWQDFPLLVDGSDTHDITPIEQGISDLFETIQFWSQLSEADKYSRVGEYSGVIFRFRDNKTFDQPVDSTNLGANGIAEVIPCWQGQLKAGTIDANSNSENYGKVTMYNFTENAVVVEGANTPPAARSFSVHPDRVHIWSRNHSIYGNKPVLKSGFNDLITIQKIIGSGGEGFWKNAKAAPILQVDKDANLSKLAATLGVAKIEDIADKLDEIIADYQKGLDKMLMLQGIEAKPQSITLGDPEKPFLVACQSFAASIGIPMKILIGSQTGERASTEDAQEWAVTCNSRRTNYVRPNIMRIVNDKLVKYGVIPKGKWFLLWSDLTEASTEEKFALVAKMADANQKMAASGPVFTQDEMREVVGWKALIPTQIKKRANEPDTSQTTD